MTLETILTSPIETTSIALSLGDILLRLLCAMVVGLVIGTEREYTNRPAGMRTHILVALGACAVMITGQVIFLQYSAYGATPDPARLSAQVITGVGFLGAGTIMREGTNVRGLTTAASLWAVACLGIAAGAGYYAIALAGMVFIFITLTIFEVIQHKLMGPYGHMDHYSAETSDIAAGLAAINAAAKACRAGLKDLRVEQLSNGTHKILFRVDIGGMGHKKRHAKFLSALASDPSLISVQLSANAWASI